MGLFSKKDKEKKEKKPEKGGKSGTVTEAPAPAAETEAVAETPVLAETEETDDAEPGFEIDPELAEMEAALAAEVDDDIQSGSSADSFAVAVKHGNPVLKIVFTLAAVLVAFALGVAGTVYYFYTTYKGADAQTAWKATHAAYNHLGDVIQYPDDLTVEDIYIRDKAKEYECILFAAVKYKPLEYTEEVFHIIIDKASGDDIVNSDLSFNEKLYESLKNGTPEERLQASAMKSEYDSIELSLEEIRAGRNHWIHASDAYCNLQLVMSGENWRKLQKEQQAAAEESAKEAISSAEAAATTKAK